MEKLSLDALARELMKAAAAAPARRASRTVYGGHEHVLRQTLMALTAGSSMSEHEHPGEATVQVFHGRGRLVARARGGGGARRCPADRSPAATPPARPGGRRRAAHGGQIAIRVIHPVGPSVPRWVAANTHPVVCSPTRRVPKAWDSVDMARGSRS